MGPRNIYDQYLVLYRENGLAHWRKFNQYSVLLTTAQERRQ